MTTAVCYLWIKQQYFNSVKTVFRYDYESKGQWYAAIQENINKVKYSRE